jgi:ankyrin repeat protein
MARLRLFAIVVAATALSLGCGMSRESFDIHGAAGRGLLEELEYYISLDPNSINCFDNHGETPLIVAIKYDQTDAIRLLLEHGADVNLGDERNGYTPLHYTAMCGGRQTSEILKHDPDLTKRDFGGLTPIDLAKNHTYNGVDKIVRILTPDSAK